MVRCIVAQLSRTNLTQHPTPLGAESRGIQVLAASLILRYGTFRLSLSRLQALNLLFGESTFNA